MEVKAEEPEQSLEARSRSVRRDIAFAFAVGLALLVTYLLRDILLLLYVSALFAVVFMPLVRGTTALRIRNWSPGRGLAIFFLLLVLAGGTTLFFVFAMPPIIRDGRQFMRELPWRGPQMLGHLRRIPFFADVNLSTVNSRIQGFVSNSAEYLLLSLTSWAGKLADIIAAIVLTIYFMLEGDIAYHWILSFFPAKTRLRLNQTLLRAEGRIGKWLLGQGLLMLILWLASTVAFVLLKIRYAYTLGILMGALNIIPVVGALVSMTLVVLAAAMDSWERVLGALIFYLIYVQVETSYLTPRIMQSSVDLPGLAILVALLLGSKIAGVVGAMVAVPTAVLVAVLVQEYAVQKDAAVRLKEKSF